MVFWQRMFLFFVLFLFFDFLFVGVLLIKYYFREPSPAQPQSSLAVFDKNFLDKTSSRWQDGQALIQALPAKQFYDFFQDFSTSTPVIIITPSTAATTTATSSQ